MLNQKERNVIEISDKVRDLSKPVNWLAQYDEEDDFISKKVLSSLPDSTEEQ